MRKPSREALNAGYALCPKERAGDQSGEFELPKLSRGDVEAMIAAAYAVDVGDTFYDVLAWRNVAYTARLRFALEEARRGHTVCADDFYSCPKSDEGLFQGPAHCTCGADEHNAKIDAALKETQ
jgi:hypothetical protein